MQDTANMNVASMKILYEKYFFLSFFEIIGGQILIPNSDLICPVDNPVTVTILWMSCYLHGTSAGCLVVVLEMSHEL